MSLEKFYSRPGHLIRRLSQISMALFIEEAGELGVTARQFAALNMIAETPDIDQVRLSQMIAMDKTTIVKVIDRLVEKGLITRTRSPTDRRANVLNITPAGPQGAEGHRTVARPQRPAHPGSARRRAISASSWSCCRNWFTSTTSTAAHRSTPTWPNLRRAPPIPSQDQKRAARKRRATSAEVLRSQAGHADGVERYE